MSAHKDWTDEYGLAFSAHPDLQAPVVGALMIIGVVFQGAMIFGVVRRRNVFPLTGRSISLVVAILTLRLVGGFNRLYRLYPHVATYCWFIMVDRIIGMFLMNLIWTRLFRVWYLMFASHKRLKAHRGAAPTIIELAPIGSTTSFTSRSNGKTLEDSQHSLQNQNTNKKSSLSSLASTPEPSSTRISSSTQLDAKDDNTNKDDNKGDAKDVALVVLGAYAEFPQKELSKSDNSAELSESRGALRSLTGKSNANANSSSYEYEPSNSKDGDDNFVIGDDTANIRWRSLAIGWFAERPWLGRDTFLWTLGLTMTVFDAGMMIMLFFFTSPSDRCQDLDYMSTYSLIRQISILLCMAVFAFKIRRKKEGYFLKEEYALIGINSLVVLAFIIQMELTEPRSFVTQSLIWVAYIFSSLIYGGYPLAKSYGIEFWPCGGQRVMPSLKELHTVHRIASFSFQEDAFSTITKSTTLFEILSSERLKAIRRDFEDHLTREFSLENLLFYDKAGIFREDAQHLSDIELAIRAVELYKEFVMVGAKSEINITSKERRPIYQELSSIIFNFKELISPPKSLASPSLSLGFGGRLGRSTRITAILPAAISPKTNQTRPRDASTTASSTTNRTSRSSRYSGSTLAPGTVIGQVSMAQSTPGGVQQRFAQTTPGLSRGISQEATTQTSRPHIGSTTSRPHGVSTSSLGHGVTQTSRPHIGSTTSRPHGTSTSSRPSSTSNFSYVDGTRPRELTVASLALKCEPEINGRICREVFEATRTQIYRLMAQDPFTRWQGRNASRFGRAPSAV